MSNNLRSHHWSKASSLRPSTLVIANILNHTARLAVHISTHFGDSPLSQRSAITNGRYCHVMYKLLYPNIRIIALSCYVYA